MKKIFLVGGGKGGVGKSSISLALIDLFLDTKEEKIFLIEMDNENPDVMLTVKDDVAVKAISMEHKDWELDFSNTLIENNDSNIIVNTGARSTEHLIKNAALFSDVAKSHNMEIVTLWVISPDADPLFSLKSFMDSKIVSPKVFVVKNTFFGDQEDFELYDTSELKERITETIVFPKLTSRIKNKLSINKAAYWSDNAILNFPEKHTLEGFRKSAKDALKVVL